VPIAAPSANRSGRPSPTTAAHVLEDMDGRIEFILDGGPTGIGLESTVIDLSVSPPILLRPGGISLEQLRAELGTVEVDPAVFGDRHAAAPRAPGMKYAHYAPRAPLTLVEGPVMKVREKINELAAEAQARGQKVGILCAAESKNSYAAPVIRSYGSLSDPGAIAASLFQNLRSFDTENVDIILAEGTVADGLGLAIMNRLRKAAGGSVIHT
jgi:L-threonylcarbamoyladenylate synthase